MVKLQEIVSIEQYSKFHGFFRLARSFETTLAGSTILMALLLLGISDISIYIRSFLAIWFGGTTINSWNDTLDLKEDKISHPDRPIPLGVYSVTQARIISVISGIISMILMMSISPKATVILTFSIGIGIIYSITTKRFLLMKNFTVSGTAFIVLMSFAWIFDRPVDIVLFSFSVSVALILFGYEILKDIHDVKGDESAGIVTLAIYYSPRRAANVAGWLFIISCLVMGVGFGLGDLRIEMWISLITAFIVAIPLFWLKIDPIPRNSDITRVSVIILLNISLGMIGFIQINKIFDF